MSFEKLINNPITQFIMGGLILAGGAYFANRANPFLAALATAFPLELVMLFFIKKREQRKSYIKSIIALSSCLILSSLSYYFIQKINMVNKITEIVLSITIWTILTTLAYIFILK